MVFPYKMRKRGKDFSSYEEFEELISVNPGYFPDFSVFSCICIFPDSMYNTDVAMFTIIQVNLPVDLRFYGLN